MMNHQHQQQHQRQRGSIQFQHDSGVWEKVARRLAQEWKTVWKMLLALVAVADVLGCWPVFVQGWIYAESQSKPGVSHLAESFGFTTHNNNNNNNNNHNNEQCSSQEQQHETCSNHAMTDMLGTALYALDWVGPLFCLLCILEAVRRAQQAREDMLEMAALDNFERKLSRLYGSTRRLSLHQSPQQAQTSSSATQEETTYEQDDLLARRTLRFWTPVLFTLFVWGLLLPWRTLLRRDCGQEADTALATLWIARLLEKMTTVTELVVEQLTEWAWSLVLPLSFWLQPHKLYMRILAVLRWVRYFRFAGPLLRVLFKLNDQFLVFFKTQQQSWELKAEKAKRELRRSMLFDDIRKIESLTKLSTQGWAKVPTWRIFHEAKEQPAEVADVLQQKKQQGTKLKRQIDDLKAQVAKSPKTFPTSEIFDRIADLSREFTSTVGSTLWSANLIPPQTRFSLSWRVIVTSALLSEVSRICTSYQLYGRVDVSYTTMMMSVLGCAQDRGGNILTATGRLTRKIVRKLVRLPKEQLLSTCTTSSMRSHGLANFLIYFASAFETTIDLVCFIDIYVWFFTGELDGASGRVVPKPFFYRCILPGTLVQVLDHPTVPDVLPNILSFSLSAASAVGYSRVIRWLVAIVPAVNLLLVDLIKSFLFRPMEDDEWLTYTESMAILPVISGADIRYAMNMSHPNFSDFQDSPNKVRRSVTLERNVNISQQLEPTMLRRTRTNSPMRKTKKMTSFVPLVPSLSELRRESSSAGLNLDSSLAGLNLDIQHDASMDAMFGDLSYGVQELLQKQSPDPDPNAKQPPTGYLSPYVKKPGEKYKPMKEIPTIDSSGDLGSFSDDSFTT